MSSGAAASYDTVVIGAGVFGTWTAWFLRQRGERVLLLDAAGPANAQASSGGESRLTRAVYGRDAVYTRMAHESLADWRWLSAQADLPLFHPVGVLFFFARREAYVDETVAVHRRLGLDTRVLERPELRSRFPQVHWDDIELGLYEPAFGALMARRAVQTLARRFVEAGGEYRQARVLPPGPGMPLTRVTLTGGENVEAEKFVFACGAWLPQLFPALLGRRIFPTRQEIFFFAPPPGDRRFSPGALPGWGDFNGGDLYYGFPDLEGRGFKIAHDAHGPPFDPDGGERIASAAGLAEVRAYMERRFPALAGRPLVESRVCQYENSSNGDFLVDTLPGSPNAVLAGGGSGHGFKHGPAVGRYVADLATGRLANAEARFGLATKAEAQARSVH